MPLKEENMPTLIWTHINAMGKIKENKTDLISCIRNVYFFNFLF